MRVPICRGGSRAGPLAAAAAPGRLAFCGAGAAVEPRTVIWLPDERTADVLAGTERLRRLFQFFAATQCRGRSLVYETLSQGEVSQFLAGIPGVVVFDPQQGDIMGA
jgi:hypothetical protein